MSRGEKQETGRNWIRLQLSNMKAELKAHVSSMFNNHLSDIEPRLKSLEKHSESASKDIWWIKWVIGIGGAVIAALIGVLIRLVL